MKSRLIVAVMLGMIAFTASVQAETGIWHRFKEYDIGNPRPAPSGPAR